MSDITKARKTNWWELGIAGTLFALGLYMVFQGFGYSIGTMRQMGAGYFPVIVGSALAFLAVGIILEVRFSTTVIPDLPFKPLASIAAGLIVFALGVERVGLIPSTFFLIVLSMSGDGTVGWKRTLIVASVISVVGYLFFGLVFRLSLSPFWW